MNKTLWASLSLCAVFWLSASAVAEVGRPVDDPDFQDLVMHEVDRGEHFHGQDHLVQPQFYVRQEASSSTFVALSAAIRSDTQHGIRYTWYYEIRKGKPKELFRKLPLDAAELVPGAVPAVKGSYWVYNCFLCDAPEAGFVYKIPVIAKKEGRKFRFSVDATAGEYDGISKEAHRQLKESLGRYKQRPAELQKMQREIDELFPRRSSERLR